MNLSRLRVGRNGEINQGNNRTNLGLHFDHQHQFNKPAQTQNHVLRRLGWLKSTCIEPFTLVVSKSSLVGKRVLA
jgi:hypothetical protein